MICATPVFDQNAVAELPGFRATPTYLVQALTSDAAPWLVSALSQIRSREDSGAVVAGVGDLRVTNGTADAARSAILGVRVKELPAPNISSISGGGLGMMWRVGDRRVEFTVYPDGEVTFSSFHGVTMEGSGNVISVLDDGTKIVEDGSEILNQFRWLMGM